ncbi:MAG TPA: SDR family NAD(P)-dependent oxidoreductase, partial [Polyangia bacterium]|nr:SDR family NAD(P)-dependent oxidoreductase [Polyangia bacterium]
MAGPAETHDVLITGAGSGIGAGLAALFGRDGHHVAVTDVDRGAAEAVAAEIRRAGGSATAAALDVTSDDSVAAALRELPRAPDVLVNNAGLQVVAPLEEFPMSRWNHLIQVMLVGVARLTRAILPGMRARGFGRVVNVGS